MSTSQDHNNQQKPQQWSYNDPYRYPIPRGDEDPWDTLLEPLLAKDKVQCDAWKDEVQNLLIFAGLFSAVVTSFVVDSSKDLQPNPNTLLLSHIATLIGNTTNGAVANIPQIQLSPSSSSNRVNALWFVSLVLSLTTVLVGIVSLQWIREHQRYSGLSPQERFSIFCMRREALEAWYVPQIFAGLPLVLLGALALYLVGLVDHLFGFGPGVAIPGVIFIALTLLFLVATTVLPTLQGLVVLPTYLEITINLPSPCPYKSPQSHVFRRLTTTFQKSFLATSWVIAQVKWVIMHFRKFLYQFIRLEASRPRFVKTSDQFPSILTIWRKASWIDFDCSWLSFRDCMLLGITDGGIPNIHYRPAEPLYDAIKGIRSIAWGNQMNTEHYLFAQFYCLRGISSSLVGEGVDMTSLERYRNTYFQLLLILESSNDLHQKAPFLSQVLARNFDSRFVSEENTLVILDIIDPDHQHSPTLSRHFAECSLRLLAAVYSEIHPLFLENESQKSLPLTISSSSLSYAIWNIKKSENETEFVHQWALSISSFFSAIINSSPDDPHLEQSFHAHTFFRHYLHGSMELIYSRTNDNLDSEILTVIVSTITEISAALNDSPNPRRDFLFYAASFYTKSLVFFSPTHPTSVSAVSTLLEALRNYKAYLGEGVPSLEKILEIPSFSHQKWWEFLTLPEVIPTPSGYASEEKMGTSLSSIPLASRKSTAKEDTSDDIPILRVQPTPYAERD